MSEEVRISSKAKDMLQQLAAQTGKKTEEILNDAVDLYRRQFFLNGTNAAFAALRANPDTWADEEEERAAWDATLSDGMED